MVSTDEDPNGNLEAYFGGLENGLTGDSGGYRHDYVDLTPYAGSTVQLRLRYATDAAFVERGWFADDFSVTADGTEVWSDDVESGDERLDPGRSRRWTDTTGAGWTRATGTADYEQYYLVEWRNHDGFDKGLRTPYTTNFFVDGEWNVNRLPYNAPGHAGLAARLGVHRSTTSTATSSTRRASGRRASCCWSTPTSTRRGCSGAAAEANPSLLDNLDSRAQANDVAFGPVGRYPFRYCFPSDPDGPVRHWRATGSAGGQGARRSPTRRAGTRAWSTGPTSTRRRRCSSATSTPRRSSRRAGNEIYSTRIVDANGRLVPDLFGLDVRRRARARHGQPGRRPAGRTTTEATRAPTTDLSLGVQIKWLTSFAHNSKALVRGQTRSPVGGSHELGGPAKVPLGRCLGTVVSARGAKFQGMTPTEFEIQRRSWFVV